MLLNKKAKKMTGRRVSFRTTDGSSLRNRTFLADFQKNVRKELPNSYLISPFLYKILLSKGGPLYTYALSYKCVKTSNSINMKITVAKNISLRILFTIGRYNHDGTYLIKICFYNNLFFKFGSVVRL